jgi:hypothetical protein
MKFVLLILGLLVSIPAPAHDCAGFKPFVPIDTIKADIKVYRLDDEVSCTTSVPQQVPVLDIRGREADWYYCDKSAVMFQCETVYKGKPAKRTAGSGDPQLVARRRT